MSYSFIDRAKYGRVTYYFPNECPVCLHTISIPDAELTRNLYRETLQTVFLCPNRECGVLFIAEYELKKDEPTAEGIMPKGASYTYVLSKFYPPKYNPKQWNQSIHE